MNAKKVFIAYAPADKSFVEKLIIHLNAMEKQGLISAWSDEEILAGEDYLSSTEKQIESAQIIMMLISADFIASDFCNDRILVPALQKHDSGSIVLIPVIVRYCDWYTMPFTKVKVFPIQDGKVLPVKDWADPDKAFDHISQELRKIIQSKTERAKATVSVNSANNEDLNFNSAKRSKMLRLIIGVILGIVFLSIASLYLFKAMQDSPNNNGMHSDTLEAKTDNTQQGIIVPKIDTNKTKEEINPNRVAKDTLSKDKQSVKTKSVTNTTTQIQPSKKDTRAKSTTSVTEVNDRTSTSGESKPIVNPPKAVTIELRVIRAIERKTVWIDDKPYSASLKDKTTIFIQNVPIGTHIVSLDRFKTNCTKTLIIDRNNQVFSEFPFCL